MGVTGGGGGGGGGGGAIIGPLHDSPAACVSPLQDPIRDTVAHRDRSLSSP